MTITLTTRLRPDTGRQPRSMVSRHRPAGRCGIKRRTGRGTDHRQDYQHQPPSTCIAIADAAPPYNHQMRPGHTTSSTSLGSLGRRNDLRIRVELIAPGWVAILPDQEGIQTLLQVAVIPVGVVFGARDHLQVRGRDVFFGLDVALADFVSDHAPERQSAWSSWLTVSALLWGTGTPTSVCCSCPIS